MCNKFDAATLAELPQPAQDYVRKTRRDRTSEFRGAKAEHAGYSPEELEAAASAIEAILERGDIIEAGYVYERGLAGQELPSTSKAADVAMAYLAGALGAGNSRGATSGNGWGAAMSVLCRPSLH